MAVLRILVSDLSGKTKASRLVFTIDGEQYEIDVTDPERQKLVDQLLPYREHGRRVPRTPIDPAQDNTIRTWAQQQYLPVNTDKPIPVSICKAYRQEHRKS